MLQEGLARVVGGSLDGLSGMRVDVEVDLAPTLPGFQMVGLPDAAARESRERIGAALRHAGFAWPDRRVTVSLAPADRRKEGAPLDLAIAVAMLLADGQLPRPPGDWLRRTLWCGELALDGAVRPARGAVALALDAARLGVERVVLPPAPLDQLSGAGGPAMLPLGHLRELGRLLRSPARGRPAPAAPAPSARPAPPPALRGQELAALAVRVAAAGGHHLLLQGPPGCGKTLVARWLAWLLPPLEDAPWRERLRILSAVGLPVDPAAARWAPLRAPHASVSVAGLLGGGRPLRPGELTLAHRGVLFLDEAPEFGRARLDALRQAMEAGEVVLARAGRVTRWPARAQVVAAANPCPCGWAGDGSRECECRPGVARSYAQRLSGPLRDRFDLQLHMWREPVAALWEGGAGGTGGWADEVARARRRALRRQRVVNARLEGEALQRACRLGAPSRELVTQWADRTGSSLRGVQAVLRVARTLADLEGAERVGRAQLHEAFSWRPGPGG